MGLPINEKKEIVNLQVYFALGAAGIKESTKGEELENLLLALYDCDEYKRLQYLLLKEEYFRFIKIVNKPYIIKTSINKKIINIVNVTEFPPFDSSKVDVDYYVDVTKEYINRWDGARLTKTTSTCSCHFSYNHHETMLDEYHNCRKIDIMTYLTILQHISDADGCIERL